MFYQRQPLICDNSAHTYGNSPNGTFYVLGWKFQDKNIHAPHIPNFQPEAGTCRSPKTRQRDSQQKTSAYKSPPKTLDKANA